MARIPVNKLKAKLAATAAKTQASQRAITALATAPTATGVRVRPVLPLAGAVQSVQSWVDAAGPALASGQSVVAPITAAAPLADFLDPLTGSSVSASVGADRFGGFENTLSYGEGAGTNSPASAKAYESLVVAQTAVAPREMPNVTAPVLQEQTRVNNPRDEPDARAEWAEDHDRIQQEEASARGGGGGVPSEYVPEPETPARQRAGLPRATKIAVSLAAATLIAGGVVAAVALSSNHGNKSSTVVAPALPANPGIPAHPGTLANPAVPAVTAAAAPTASSAGSYYVFTLDNVASPGNIWIGQVSDFARKAYTCNWIDGGQCPPSVPVKYTKQLGPFPTYTQAQHAYCQEAVSPHAAFGGEKVYIFNNSYFIDNLTVSCPTEATTSAP